jgi:hypothetical protein
MSLDLSIAVRMSLESQIISKVGARPAWTLGDPTKVARYVGQVVRSVIYGDEWPDILRRCRGGDVEHIYVVVDREPTPSDTLRVGLCKTHLPGGRPGGPGATTSNPNFVSARINIPRASAAIPTAGCFFPSRRRPSSAICTLALSARSQLSQAVSSNRSDSSSSSKSALT